MSLTEREWIDRAYKKLKGALYFDKTQLCLIDKVVSFECDALEDSLSKAAEVLTVNEDVWEDYISDIIDKIDVLVFPKKLKVPPDTQIIFNADDEPIEMEKPQYFIDLPVIGHVFGVLWVLTVGAELDSRNDPDHMLMYEHSYGNRLRKNLYHSDNGNVTFSPYLFEPYFSQYQNWRDTALDYAMKRLDHRQDALILTLDLRSFFYGIHFSETDFNSILSNKLESLPDWARRIHGFVYRVLKAYSDKVRSINIDPELNLGERVFLPIGFLPSNILSNWFLTPFDKAICEQINPVYYGRYVDDIIIVDKVEKNSFIRKKALGKAETTEAEQRKLTAKDVIEYYFCTGSKGAGGSGGLFSPLGRDEMSPQQEKVYKSFALKLSEDRNASEQENQGIVYRIRPDLLQKDQNSTIKPDIQIQNDKVKIFYFREGATRALLNCFRSQIGSNVSEFRFLPDMEMLLEKNDYSEIFKLENSETPNKLRGVTNVSLDKFSVSKFLGKYRKAGGMIHDKKETAFDKDLLAIFSKRVLIENYILWERLLEIMLVNAHYDSYEKLVKNILQAISEFQTPIHLLNQSELQRSKNTLLLNLKAAICRTVALCWGKRIYTILKSIQEEAKKKSIGISFNTEEIEAQKANYCKTHMINKYVLPLPIDWFNQPDEILENDINLCNINDFFLHFKPEFPGNNQYYPYMITPQEISFAFACMNINQGEKLYDPEEQKTKVEEAYRTLNYPSLQKGSQEAVLDSVMPKRIQKMDPPAYAVSVGNQKAGKIKIAIGNARLQKNDFKQALLGKPRLSYQRYQQTVRLLHDALSENADILVLPECFLPWEWVPQIARLCANNGMALVTGIEPVLSGEIQHEGKTTKKVYNLTAVILPYQEDEYKYSHIVYHHKVHYSPEEKREILGYRLEPIEGRQYEVFHWKDLWFPVYCCFELASIKERALFQSIADLTVAVEWNKDVGYFGSIIESMCRDLHCYCLQVNSSDYGDSRVILPTKAESRDLIKTKGGLNQTILTDEIDIDALRDFQRKEYELQRDDKRFKPTPPNFNPYFIELKQQGKLMDFIKKVGSAKLVDAAEQSGTGI